MLTEFIRIIMGLVADFCEKANEPTDCIKRVISRIFGQLLNFLFVELFRYIECTKKYILSELCVMFPCLRRSSHLIIKKAARLKKMYQKKLCSFLLYIIWRQKRQ